MSLAKDTCKTCLGLFLLTWSVLSLPGCLGGLLYLDERSGLLEKRTPVPEFKIDPLTQSEIDLIERLKESTEDK